MQKAGRIVVCVVAAMLAGSAAMFAEVTTREKSLVSFDGMLGTMANLFGGKAAKEGVVTTVSVKGDRKMTMGDTTGRLIDLKDEKLYDLDLRNKTYTVTTFEELRRRMAEARQRAEKDAAKQSGKPPEKDQSGGKQAEIDFNIRETGQKRAINGFDTREVLMTIAVREKGKTLEQGGGLLMTASNWLGPTIAAYKDVSDFDRRYAEKLNGPMAVGDVQAMAAALAMYPYMKDALQRFQQENVSLDGTPVLTTVTIEAVKSPEQVTQETQEEPQPSARGGFGGLGGLLAKKVMKKGEDTKDATSAPNRAKVMTMTHELLQVTPAATDAEVSIPPGFREKQ